jgi:hypothetical protein
MHQGDFLRYLDLAKLEVPLTEEIHVVKAGNVLNETYSTLRGSPCIKKISKEEYINLATGEVKDFQHNEKRIDNKVSLLQTFRNLRAMINANVTSSEDVLFCTLTYKNQSCTNCDFQPMNNREKAYLDFNNFSHKLYRYFSNNGIKKPRIISVIEPQETGAWHFHFICFWDKGQRKFIPNSVIEKLWGQGFTKIEKTKGVDNLGSYLSAYLTDLKQEGHMAEKRARLPYYPIGIKLWRCSRNCLRPYSFWSSEEVIKKDLKGATLRSLEVCSLVIKKKQTIPDGVTANDLIERICTTTIVRKEYNLNPTQKYNPVIHIHDYAIMDIVHELSLRKLILPVEYRKRYIAELERRNDEQERKLLGMSFFEYQKLKQDRAKLDCQSNGS